MHRPTNRRRPSDSNQSMGPNGSKRRKQMGPDGPGGPRGPGRGGPMGRGMGMPAEKAKNAKETYKKLLNYMGVYKKIVVIVIILAALSTTASIVGPKILGNATTELYEGIIAEINGTGTVDFDAILVIILTVLGLYVGSALVSYLQGWIMADISTNVTYRMRRDFMQKINRMPLRYFDGQNHGEVISRITNDIDTVNQSLSQGISQIITSVVTVIGVLIMMFSISWEMTLISLIILPVSMVLMGGIMKRSQKYFVQQQKSLGNINGHVEEMYGSHVVMKAFNGEVKSIEKFIEFNDILYESAWKSTFLSGMMMPLMMFIGNLGYVCVAIFGGFLAFQGRISLGDIQAFTQYVRSFTRPLSQLANISNMVQSTAAAAERVFEFLDEEEEIPETKNPVKINGQIKGHVEFKNVKFGYLPNKTIIKDFSAVAHPGQKVAIVGPTGAGKTTMVKLLMRFYDVNEGAILVDQHEIHEMTRKDLRNIYGMVLQDTWLYNASIMENIRFGRPDATDEEVIAAAKTAHADHFIRTLPEGYNLKINEEINNISQGQMQLLTIARAVLADPKILILDEATSSVDTRTEILIQKGMDALMENRTSFVIAHRLSTIVDADLILVMKEGDIVEQGNHKELLDEGGFYAELYNSQFDVNAA